MNRLRNTAHIPIAALTMESETGQKMLAPLAITSLILATPGISGPPQIQHVTWQWSPEEMRDFAAKILHVADELEFVVAPLGQPTDVSRPQAFDEVKDLIQMEKDLLGVPFGDDEETTIKREIDRAKTGLARGGWSYDELKAEIGSDVRNKFDAFERARRIVERTRELGELTGIDYDTHAERLRKEISLEALALQAAGYDVEKLIAAVEPEKACGSEACGCGGTPDDKIQVDNKPGFKVQIGPVILTVTPTPAVGTDVQLDPSARVTAQNLAEAFQRYGVNAEAWAEGESLIVRELRHPLDFTMRTVTHWRIKDGDGEELILDGDAEDGNHARACQQLLGETSFDRNKVQVEAVKTVAMKEMDFRALREFQG